MNGVSSPLEASHARVGAKLVTFAGWRLPLQFTSVAAETRATRNSGALFDISHMGMLRVRGDGARASVRRLLTRDTTRIPPGCSAYALLCNDSGGILDDLFVMVESPGAVRLVVNAVNHEKDTAWLRRHLTAVPGVVVEDLRGETFGLAVQGPAAEQVVCETGLGRGLPELFAQFAEIEWEGSALIVSRTGYTGEDGFEVFGAKEAGLVLWEKLLAAGRELGVVAAGLAARDVLRQEMGYPLWGQDLDEETTPLEAGLGWAVDWEGDFIGRAALEGDDPSRRRIGFLMENRAIARAGAQISLGGRPAGRVTSGTYSHNLSAGIGQGYVEASANVDAGEELGVEVRGAEARARAAKLPLLPRRTRESWAQSQQRQEQ